MWTLNPTHSLHSLLYFRTTSTFITGRLLMFFGKENRYSITYYFVGEKSDTGGEPPAQFPWKQ